MQGGRERRTREAVGALLQQECVCVEHHILAVLCRESQAHIATARGIHACGQRRAGPGGTRQGFSGRAAGRRCAGGVEGGGSPASSGVLRHFRACATGCSYSATPLLACMAAPPN